MLLFEIFTIGRFLSLLVIVYSRKALKRSVVTATVHTKCSGQQKSKLSFFEKSETEFRI